MKISLNNKIVLAIISSIFSSILLSCSKPKIDTITGTQLVIPDYSGSKDFSLSAATGTRTFYGQMLIWDPNVTSEKVAEVLTLKRKANEAMVENIRALDDYMKTVLQPASVSLDRLVQEKQRIESEAGPRVRQQSLQVAQSWFENEVTQNLGSGAATLPNYSRNVFTSYCEAKLFTFGTSTALASMQFQTRPTALAVCESVYRAAGMFSDASCEPSSEAKNFFGCFWKHGILKTKIASRYSAAQKTAIEAMVSDNNFQKIFSGNTDANCSLIKIRGSNRIRTAATSDSVVNHILNGTKNQEFSCNGVQGTFSLSDAQPGSSPTEQASPAKIAGDLEARSVNCASMLCFVPTALADGSVVSDTALQWGTKISRQLMAFGSQSLSCGTARASWWTKNFVVFNAPLTIPSLPNAVCNESEATEYPNVFVADSDSAKAKQDVENAVADFQAKKMKACITFNDACDKNSAYNKLRDQEQSAASAASAAALQRGVAISVVPSFTINTQRSDNGIDIISVNIESKTSGEKWTICLNNGAVANCTAGVIGPNDKSLRAASFDTNTGILSLDINLDETSIFADQENAVHKLVLRDFPGSILHIELLPALMGSFVPYLSGNVSVRKNGVQIYQGVAYGVDTAMNRAHERIFYSH